MFTIDLKAAKETLQRLHDLALQHDFHTTKQGLRFTISDTARREILDRLLALNHSRYAQEVAAGLHNVKNKSKKYR